MMVLQLQPVMHIRHLLLRFGVTAWLLIGPMVTHAQDHAAYIADRIGSLSPRAEQLMAIALTGMLIGRYNERFGASDNLDDQSWAIVQDRILDMSHRVHRVLAKSIDGNEARLRDAFISELRKQAPGELASVAKFLGSADGEQWRKANFQFESHYSDALVISALYAIASRRRAQALESRITYQQSSRISSAPLLVVGITLRGPRNTPGAFLVFGVLKLLVAIDPLLDSAAEEATLAAGNGMKDGLPRTALGNVDRSLGNSVSQVLTDLDVNRILGTNFANDYEKELGDLASRAAVAVAISNPVKNGQCNSRLNPEVIQASGGDIQRLGGSVKVGSLEHIWLAEAYERGCHVKKDFSIALRNWIEIANSGNAKVLCKIVNWYRLGIGTDQDIQQAQAWEERAKAMHFGKACEPLAIDFRNPWSGLAK